MAFDQSKAFTQLEKIIKEQDKENFFFDFMLAFNTPRATITKLKNNIGSDVSSNDGEFRIKNKIHFKQVSSTTNLHAECDLLKDLPSTSKEKMRFILVTDFQDIVAYDTKAKALLDVEFVDLHKNYAFFLPLAGIEKYELTDEHPADIKAAYKLGQLCDVIRRHNEIDSPDKVHAFNVFLTRLLFCFYAEDTGIFSDNQLIKAVQNTTDKNGSDLDSFFAMLFHVLNLPNDSEERRALPSHFASFPYVNGGLFASDEWIPQFTGKARRMIIEAGSLEWDQINPDIFGSMFQSVIDPEQRGKLGQHYTSVPNIMKVIQPLFLDGLEDALDKAKASSRKLQALLMRIQRIRIFDSACGSGNFLIIAYKELRKFEMKVLKALDALGEQSVMFMSGIRLTQFYGIEIDDFAHEIALLSLWLAENQMNKLFEAEFGYSEPMLPLKDSGNIVHGNALRLNWEEVCPKSDEQGDLEVYICSNPPFLGKQNQSKEQRAQQMEVMGDLRASSDLDFVSCWFVLAARYCKGSSLTQAAFVATSSICQGEQVSILWGELFRLSMQINFAYRPFIWENSAQKKAAVHCTVLGISDVSISRTKKIIDPKGENSQQTSTIVKNISPYLIEGPNTLIFKKSKPFLDKSTMVYGNKPSDDGFLILNNQEKQNLVREEPLAERWVRKYQGANELLYSIERWCLWLVGIKPEELDAMPLVKKRVDGVRAFRLKSTATPTRKMADRPEQFFFISQPDSKYIAVPETSSEKRSYIPISYVDGSVISSNLVYTVPNASLYEFSILTSEMHNDWMRAVAGRLESRYRYTASLVYNTFPWPEVSSSQEKQISKLGEEILLARADYPDKTLAQLYDPDEMPEALRQAHRELDLAVEQLYRAKPFEGAAERVAFLFKRYEQLINTKEGNDA